MARKTGLWLVLLSALFCCALARQSCAGCASGCEYNSSGLLECNKPCIDNTTGAPGSGFIDWEAKEAAREERRAYKRYEQARKLNKQGIQAFERGDYKEAYALFQEADATDPNQIYRDNMAKARQGEANIFNDLGRQAYERGDYRAAVGFFQQAGSIDPDYLSNIDMVHWAESKSLNKYGRQAFDKGDFKAAISFFEQANTVYLDQAYRDNVSRAKEAEEKAQVWSRYEQKIKNEARREAAIANDSIQTYIRDMGRSSVQEDDKDKLDFLKPREMGIGNDTNAGRQLKAAVAHGTDAAQGHDVMEDSSDKASLGFDTSGKSAGDLAPPVSAMLSDPDQYGSDPRMVAAKKQLDGLHAEIDELDEKIETLTRERNNAKDLRKVKELSTKIDGLNATKSATMAKTATAKDKISKLKRRIDNEVAKKKGVVEGEKE